MRIFFLLIHIFVFTNAGTLNSAMKTILPPCTVSCLKPLLDLVEDMVDNTITVKRFKSLCLEYDETLECAAEDCNDRILGTDWMSAVLSGVKYACVEERDYFDQFLFCVERYYNAKSITRGCESGCHLRKSLQDYVEIPEVGNITEQRPGSLRLLPHLSDVCSSLSCYTQCFRRDMNAYCGTGGSRLAEVILRPFEVLATQIKVSSPNMFSFLTKDINSSCSQFFNPQQVNEIRFDKDYLDKMRAMLDTRMQRELHTNTGEHPELKKLSRLPGPVYKPVPAPWTPYSVVCVVLMTAVIVMILVGLAFFVFRCVHDAFRKRLLKKYLNEPEPKKLKITARRDEVRIGVESEPEGRVITVQDFVADEERPSTSA